MFPSCLWASPNPWAEQRASHFGWPGVWPPEIRASITYVSLCGAETTAYFPEREAEAQEDEEEPIGQAEWRLGS